MIFFSRLFALFRRSQLDREMAEEMQAHIDREAERNRAAGMDPDEARFAALRQFGGIDQLKERERAAWGLVWLESLLKDFRFAVRSLARTPGFSAIAILTLAFGLTANAVVFLFANDLFLRPLPAQNPEQLVVIAQRSPQFEMAFPFSYPDLEDFRRMIEGAENTDQDLTRAFSGLMGFKEEIVHFSAPGEVTERGWVHAVSNNYFSVLGVQAAHGRLFLPSEGVKPGTDPIIVLTDETWCTRFARDPRIIGQLVKLNGLPFTVVGVTPPGFFGASWGTSLTGFVPATMLPQLSQAHGWMIFNRGETGFFLMGRLRPGSELTQVRAAMEVAMARLVQAHPQQFAPHVRPVVMRERMSRPSPFVANYMPLVIAALVTLAFLVLGVAGANVANLLYARAAARERELAVRGALGATRARLLRQLLVESLALALAAGIVGTVAIVLIDPYLAALAPAPGEFAPAAQTGLDWRPFVFTLAAALATGLLTGALPAWRATRRAILPMLHHSSAAARNRHPLRSLLVVGQIAVSSVVLVCAGLAGRSLRELARTNLGFQPANLLLASFDLGMQRYDDTRKQGFQQQLLERVRELPGVRAASLTAQVPFTSGGGMKGGVIPAGRPPEENTRFQFLPCLVVGNDYLNTAGFSVAAGRLFTARDDAKAPRVAIINRVLADYFWPGRSPLGEKLSIQGDIV